MPRPQYTSYGGREGAIASLLAFVSGQAFQKEFEDWILGIAEEFTDEEEHKLRYTVLFNEFTAMFESRMEDLLSRLGLDANEFYRQCKQESDNDPQVAAYLDVVIASTSYEGFVELARSMRPAAEAKRLADEARAQRKSSKGSAEDFDDDDDDAAGSAKRGSKGSGAKASAKHEAERDELFRRSASKG